ncbi:MAG TPA: hypothetical protein VMV77_04620 [Bacteroidales bacterium]|nr:hypothetical protein [Bacteroidales bacterium]
MKNIYFFANGNSSVFINGEQMPVLQEAWIQLFFKYLVEKGYDPLDFEIKMPNGSSAKAFKTSDGNFNWEIKH